MRRCLLMSKAGWLLLPAALLLVAVETAITTECGDGVRSGNETGVDCGGPHCPPCADGELCSTASAAARAQQSIRRQQQHHQHQQFGQQKDYD